MMVDYAKYRVGDLKKLLLARQLPANGLKATLVERLTQSDALHVSIEEVINGGVKQEIPSTVPPTQSENKIGNAKRQNLHDVLDTLKSIPGFAPASDGHMMLKQENSYTSSQSRNPQPTPTTYNASQSSPYTNLDAVQFSENDFSDDDNIDLDTDYDLPMSQSSFTHSQSKSQSGVHSQYHMSPSTQKYGRAPPSSSYQGYAKMTQDLHAPATPIQRQRLTTLQNNQKLAPSSFKTHTPGNTKFQIKSERSTSDSPFNSSLPDFSTSQATPQLLTSASSSSINIKTRHVGLPSKSLVNVPYLSYYQMEQIYYTSVQGPQTGKEKLARRQWLAKLGIDVNPFNLVYVDPLQRDSVEVHWALKSPEIRRDIEKKAIRLKQPYSKREVPLRLAPFVLRTSVPIKLIGPVPLSFDELEQKYFNIPQRKTLAYHDLIPERLGWLKELDLDDPRYLPLSQTALERHALNNLYDEKPRVERRAIEAKAKYINAMINPPNPSWETLEQAYEIYPASAFTTYAAYLDKRRQWLQKLSLDIIPFCYKTLELSEGNMQGMEVAWSVMTEIERNRVLETAKIIKEDSNPVVDSWSDFEYTYGFTKEKDMEFKNDAAGYAKKREYWIIDIGLNVDPFNNANSTPTSLQTAWFKKPIEERKSIITKAKYEKERYVRDLARKKAEKGGDNYKAPPTEAKKTSKCSSTSTSSSNRVSKSSSSRYAYSGYFGKSTASRNYGYSGYRYGRCERYGRY